MATAPVFFDTNILVYLFSLDEPEKQSVAETLYVDACADASATVSTQVMQEFYAVTTRTVAHPLPPATARLAAQEFSGQNLVRLEAPMLLRAMDRTTSDSISFWDALIVEAALAGGCRTLYSEDLQHGRAFGPLRVVNPFGGA
jgi:predicted nucleic acid-binding protein